MNELHSARNAEDVEQHAHPFLNMPLGNLVTGIVATVSGKSLMKLTSSSAVQRSVSGPAHMTALGNLETLFPLATMSL